MSSMDAAALLASLRPVADLKIMDLVAEAGVDVSPWAVKEGGAPVANPKANPNYCYEWAFGKGDEPIVLCIWFDTLTARPEGIVFEDNLRQLAKKLEDIRFEKSATPSIKSRAKDQAKRCDRFDRRLQLATTKSLPVRVILLDGVRADELGHDSSKVRFRKLDSVEWWIHEYDRATGAFLLVRGKPASIAQNATEDVLDAGDPQYVDQFSAPEPVARRERTVDAFVRSPEVRRGVLMRAGGCCEYCGKKGFLTSTGQIYLETHHVVPLAEDGPHIASNVVALCPDDHRRAHYAADCADIRESLLEYLAGLSTNVAVPRQRVSQWSR